HDLVRGGGAGAQLPDRTLPRWSRTGSASPRPVPTTSAALTGRSGTADPNERFRPESVSRAATRRSRFLRSWLPAGIVERDSAGSSRKESHLDGDDIRYAGPDPRQDTGRGGRPVADGGGRDARCHRTVRQARPDRGTR